ncbi:MAG: Gfo/Idh/MocA family oxidoreductase [Planctomycetaceae bacterium]|nr:Gfo/Idh/MocA family oxidoreductase [Planctomycetaceae bacterium]
MNLYTMMLKRKEESGPIRVGVIGAGKFSSMFLTEALNSPGIHVVGVADIRPDNARASLKRTGWSEDMYSATSLEDALKTGKTAVIEDSAKLFACGPIEVVLEITGNPHVGVKHALQAIENGKHIVMVNVEADCMVGPYLNRLARKAGVIVSMAYGDQPALICEEVDWVRAIGMEIVAAGKGTKYLPHYHDSTPDTIWDYYGFTKEQLAKGDYNPKMFNSFLDGTKSAIEMAAIANGTGLLCPDDGLSFPGVGTHELPEKLIPKSAGGLLDKTGVVEVISSLNHDGTPVQNDLRFGVYVTFKARTEYAGRCFAEYGMKTDKSGMYSCMYRPSHLIGLELGVSIASIVLRGEPTGESKVWHGDVASVAKKDLAPGEMLDGEGGYTVWGKCIPAKKSAKLGVLPLGLALNAKVNKPIAKGSLIRWEDVEVDENEHAVKIRKAFEKEFGPEAGGE